MYTDNPGCPRCRCPLENALLSAPDAPWRSCDCVCHETARIVLLRKGPVPR